MCIKCTHVRRRRVISNSEEQHTHHIGMRFASISATPSPTPPTSPSLPHTNPASPPALPNLRFCTTAGCSLAAGQGTMAMPGSALKGLGTQVTQPGTPFTPYSQPYVSLLTLQGSLYWGGWYLMFALHCQSELVNDAAIKSNVLLSQQTVMPGIAARPGMETAHIG